MRNLTRETVKNYEEGLESLEPKVKEIYNTLKERKETSFELLFGIIAILQAPPIGMFALSLSLFDEGICGESMTNMAKEILDEIAMVRSPL